MAINIDTTSAFRFPSELERLVDAVRAAGEHDESEWLEWKSTINATSTKKELLLTPNATHLIARNVLGFANRNPNTASNWAEGHAYLLIGVEPSNLHGVPSSDPAKIHAQVRVFVGTRVTWRCEFVTLGDKQVLVVVVEPPRAGDPIHALMKSADKYQEGHVFIRHPGATEQANADDIEMLTRRASRATDNLKVGVGSAVDTIEVATDPKQVAAEWRIREESKMMAPLTGERSGSLPGTVSLPRLSISEHRSEEEYRREVEDYLDKAESAVGIRMACGNVKHIPAMLRMELKNDLDYHLADLIVEAYVFGALPYSENFLHQVDDHHVPDLPKRPPLYGNGGPVRRSGWTRPTDEFKPLVPRLTLPRGWSTHVYEGVTHIEFDEVDLRAQSGVYLPPVPLMVVPEAPEVDVHWEATASNRSGRLSGEFSLRPEPSSLNVDDVLYASIDNERE